MSWDGTRAGVWRGWEAEGDAPVRFRGVAEDPVVDLDKLGGFGLPGVVAADVVLGGAALVGEGAGVGGEGGEEGAEVGDDLAAAAQGEDVAGVGWDELGWAAVIEDDGRDAEGHGLQNDAAAELAEAGENQHVALLQAGLELAVVYPAVEAGGGLDLELVDEGLEAGALGSVANQVELELSGAEEGGGGFEEHVHAFEGDEATDEGGAQGAGGARGTRGEGEAGGVDGVFREEDGLRVQRWWELAQGGAGGGDEGGGVLAGAAEAGEQGVKAAEAAGGVFFLTADVVEAGGPGDAAVEGAEDEGEADLLEPEGEVTGGGGGEGEKAVDEVELASAEAGAELLPEGALEEGVGEVGEDGVE